MDAGTPVDREAAQLADLYQLAQNFPGTQEQLVQQALASYAQLVIHEEWLTMETRSMSANASAALTEIWRRCNALESRTYREEIVFFRMLDSLVTLGECRRSRALALKENLPGPLWFAVVAGAAIMVVFSYLFGLESAHPSRVSAVTRNPVIRSEERGPPRGIADY